MDLLSAKRARLTAAAVMVLCIVAIGCLNHPGTRLLRSKLLSYLSQSKPVLKQENNTSTVLVVFSNHLDIGYDGIWPVLGLDNNVINKYFDEFFPLAIQLGQEYSAAFANATSSFVWTTHAYLLSLFLDCPPGMGLHCPSREAVANLTRSIRQGHITWHAYPHNAQLELADPSMVEFGVDLVHELDRRFGQPLKRTLSQRDVPGLSRTALPILVGKGVRAINVGVNSGSAPPGVPKNTMFIWRDVPSGAQVLAAWHPGGYGGIGAQDCVRVPGFNTVLCPAWREDNQGPPPSVNDITDTLNFIQLQFPGASVKPATFDEYLHRLEAALPDLELPVVTGEIGDTWIHGVQSDPLKITRYRSVQRIRRWCLREKKCDMHDYAFRNFSRLLHKVHEHTWGVAIGQVLGDYQNWTNTAFHAALAQKRKNYMDSVLSWVRQGLYVDWAVESLPRHHLIVREFKQDMETLKQKAAQPGRLALQNAQKHSLTDGPLRFKSQSWMVDVNPATGALQRLQRVWPGEGVPAGVDWAGGSSSAFGQIQYTTLDEASFNETWQTYMYFSWLPVDFGKYNCSKGNPRLADTVPTLTTVYSRPHANGLVVLLHYTFPAWAVQDAGAPEAMWAVLHLHDSPQEGASLHGRYPDDLHLDVVWVNKTATRLPEALWVKFQPGAVDADSWRLNKLGSWIRPDEVMFNGSRSLHAVQEEAVRVLSSDRSEELTIGSLDASLVSPGLPWLLPKVLHSPDMSKGVSFNLANNLWGTNYAQWVPFTQEDVTLAFRFFFRARRLTGGQAAAT